LTSQLGAPSFRDTLPHGHLLDQFTLLVVDLRELDRRADPRGVFEPEVPQMPDRVRPQREPGRPTGRLRVLLVDLDLHPGPLQRERRGQATDAAAHDHHPAQVGHIGPQATAARGR